jgi:hypothetical protein
LIELKLDKTNKKKQTKNKNKNKTKKQKTKNKNKRRRRLQSIPHRWSSIGFPEEVKKTIFEAFLNQVETTLTKSIRLMIII